MRHSPISPSLSPKNRLSGVSFSFKFERHPDTMTSITHYLPLPLAPFVNLHELAQHVMSQHQIPACFEQQLLEELDTFIDSYNEKLENDRIDAIQKSFHADFGKNKSLILLQLNKLNLLKRSDSRQLTSHCGGQNGDEDLQDNFRKFYHELMHSGSFSQPLITLENAFAHQLSKILDKNRSSLNELAELQSQEMERFVKLVGSATNEGDVNLLSVQHFAQIQQLRADCDEEAQKCRQEQKEQFAQWIFNVYYDYESGETESILKRIENFATSSGLKKSPTSDHSHFGQHTEVMQESFTINLGAQLKSTHNLRLSAINVLDLCRPESQEVVQPHKLHTAMSLYSHQLTAVVLFVNRHLKHIDGFQRQFGDICDLSTELHFSSFAEQMELIAQESRRLQQSEELGLGDVYVTRHSNLAQVHLAFHVVSDDTVVSNEINSRNPVILGLRNVLKLCYLYEVGTISIPLLLINELSENITIQWCMKRAELVLKCVKGFMIEISSYTSGREEAKTIQFVVPKGISDDLFRSLASMVSTIFRISNPLILK